MAKRSNYEVELRGILSKSEYNRLARLLAARGKFKGRFSRLLIDYTRFMKRRSVDVRARITNGMPEMIVKEGVWLSNARKEHSLRLEKGEFVNAVRLYGALGYRKGVVAYRRIKRYIYKGVEFSLVEVVKTDKRLREKGVYAYMYEAEVLTSEDMGRKAGSYLSTLLDSLNLSRIGSQEFARWVEFDVTPNSAAIFDSSKDDPEAFFRNILKRI